MMIDAKKHLVTIIYEPGYEDAIGQTVYGDDEFYNHSRAIDNIEKKMAYKFDWPQISIKERQSQEKVIIHNKLGNIVIENTEENDKDANLWIFIPNNLSDEKKEMIKNFINDNRENISCLAIFNGNDHTEINIDEFLHNKTLHFTNNVQNNKKN